MRRVIGSPVLARRGRVRFVSLRAARATGTKRHEVRAAEKTVTESFAVIAGIGAARIEAHESLTNASRRADLAANGGHLTAGE